MRSQRKAVMVLALAGLLAACSPFTTRVPPDASFSTRIADNDLKFFVYRWDLDEKQLRPRDRGALSGFDAALKDRLQASGYCREGYIMLSRVVVRDFARARGECRDLANDQDRARFAAGEGDS